MRDVFSHHDFTLVGHYKGVLDEAGIPCFIRNEGSLNQLTAMPDNLSLPALAVTNDEDYDRAIELLRAFMQAPEPSTADWKCAKCGETVPGNFDSCWKCGTPRAA